MVLTKIGASLGGSADTITVTQGSHGFVANDRGKAVKMTDSSGTPTYALATANTVANADAIGIIIQVIDTTKFIIALSGRITVNNAVPDLAAGTVLFLPLAANLGVVMGGTNSGHLTATEPSSAGEVSKPMAVITIADSEMIMLQQRGEVISSGATTVADNSVTSAKIVDGAILNADINASADIAFTKLADLTDGNILVGNGSNVPTSVNPSGDIDISNAGVFELNATAISGFAAKTTVVDADTVLLGDSEDSSNLKKMTRANFVAGVGGSNSFTNDVTITSGNLVMATAGKGIDFSAQTASSTGTVSSEVLDHYEEGTFTPSFADAWNAGAGSYANRVGYYTKIGNMVYASGFVALSSISGLTGGNHARVVGLPFANHSASSAETAAFVGQCGGLAIAQYASITGGFGAGQSGFLLYLWDATGGTTNLSITELSASGSIRFEVSYRV